MTKCVNLGLNRDLWLGTLAAPEDPHSNVRSQVMGYNHLVTPIPNVSVPTSGLLGHCLHVAQKHTYRQNTHTYEIKKKSFFTKKKVNYFGEVLFWRYLTNVTYLTPTSVLNQVYHKHRIVSLKRKYKQSGKIVQEPVVTLNSFSIIMIWSVFCPCSLTNEIISLREAVQKTNQCVCSTDQLC